MLSRKQFRVRANCTPRQLGTYFYEDRRTGVRWEYPVIMVPGFGRADAKFIPLDGGKVADPILTRPIQ